MTPFEQIIQLLPLLNEDELGRIHTATEDDHQLFELNEEVKKEADPIRFIQEVGKVIDLYRQRYPTLAIENIAEDLQWFADQLTNPEE